MLGVWYRWVGEILYSLLSCRIRHLEINLVFRKYTYLIRQASIFNYPSEVKGRKVGKGKSLHKRQGAHQARAYPGFSCMKRLGIFLLPPGWDASPSQGYPPALNSPVPFIHLGGVVRKPG